jgi:hypothetical protein
MQVMQSGLIFIYHFFLFSAIISLQVYFQRCQEEKNIRRILLKILFLLYLTSSYLNAVHIHSSQEAHADNCKVCIVAKALQSADVPQSGAVSVFPSGIYELNFTLYGNLRFFTDKGYDSTAPPFFH